jgi:glycosyltransferase involved in cell wall biosynthesis
VVKEANVYARAGFKVTVYATWHDQNLLEADRLLLEPTITYKAGANLLDWNGLQTKIIRLRRLLGRFLVKYLGIQTRTALGYDFKNYLKKLESENADLYIGHQEQGMALAKALIEKDYKVAFDFEDWHSKDLMPKDRAYRPTKLLELLEKYLLEKATYCYTTSESMAAAMSSYHHAPKPEVIYNSFFASDRKRMDGHRKDLNHHLTPSVYWFSQVIGRGRGLELLFEALSLVKTPFQLHLRGKISDTFRQELQSMTPKNIELYIHDLVVPDELISRIAEHDLGIAFEESLPESRNYTVTNKVFHYLQSGIPILATETAGQLEIAEKIPGAIKVVKRHPIVIASAFDNLLGDLASLRERKEASWKSGQDIFSFENQAAHLLYLTNQTLTF